MEITEIKKNLLTEQMEQVVSMYEEGIAEVESVESQIKKIEKYFTDSQVLELSEYQLYILNQLLKSKITHDEAVELLVDHMMSYSDEDYFRVLGASGYYNAIIATGELDD